MNLSHLYKRTECVLVRFCSSGERTAEAKRLLSKLRYVMYKPHRRVTKPPTVSNICDECLFRSISILRTLFPVSAKDVGPKYVCIICARAALYKS